MLIDAHAHLKPTAQALDALLASMQRLDINQSIVVGGGLATPAELSLNIGSAKIATQKAIRFDHVEFLWLCYLSEGRLVPFYFANPWIEPTEYINIGQRFRGLKIGPAVHGCALNSKETQEYIDVAAVHRHPIYLHCLAQDGFRVADLVELARKNSKQIFMLGHGGIGNLDFLAVDEIVDQENIYFETSGTFKAVVLHALATLGVERVLFGSEYPLQSASAELAKMRDLGLSETDFEKVVAENIARILKVAA